MSDVATYSIASYGDMVADRVRFAAYAAALRQRVTPDSVVLEIGTGTGIFALLACQLGARHVYAIEPDNSIQVARELAVVNGYSDRITFIQDISTQVTLPERADLIISDLRGLLPLFQHHLPTLADARRRLLAPNGILLPQQDILWAALVSAPELYRRTTATYVSDLHSLNVTPATQRLVNQCHKVQRVLPEQLLTAPEQWITLDYRTCGEPNATGKLRWEITKTGEAHGFCVWFDSVIDDGIQFSTAPGTPETIYGRAFFPWPRPLKLAIGHVVQVNLQAHYVNRDYIWHWDTTVTESATATAPQVMFSQSTFHGLALTPQTMEKRSEKYAPILNEAGKIQLWILEKMQRGLTIGAIAGELVAQFPSQFTNQQQALAHVANLAQRFS